MKFAIEQTAHISMDSSPAPHLRSTHLTFSLLDLIQDLTLRGENGQNCATRMLLAAASIGRAAASIVAADQHDAIDRSRRLDTDAHRG